MLADFRELSAAIRRLYGRALGKERSQIKEINQEELASLVDVGADEIDNIEDLSQDESPVSRYINQILLDAVRKAHPISTLNLMKDVPSSSTLRWHFDRNSATAKSLESSLISSYKILSKLDIAERRLPQDGRIKLKLNQDTAIDMRVSSTYLVWREDRTRLLDSSSASLDIDKLGYSEQQKQLYLEALRRPQV